MKNIFPVLRIIGFVLIAFLIAEWTIDTNEGLAIVEYPMIWMVLLVVLALAVAVEVSVGALQNILYRSLSRADKHHYLKAEELRKEKQLGWVMRKYKKMLGAKPMEQEEEIVLDHNYDGIRELDNNLPPWWVYGFYASIIFAVFYMLKYQVFDGDTQLDEYQAEIAQAKTDIKKYKETHKDEIDANTVELLTEGKDLKAGEAIFTANCVACHRADGGGGIGPNLTDEHWILGGGIKNVYHTISEGGRSGKGMIAWKNDLKPSEMQQVGSYVISLQGSDPADAKEAEGEVWEESDASE